MLDDAWLARARDEIARIEREVIAYLAATTDVAEKDSALIVRRQATGLRKPLETWIALRACRAQLGR